MNRMRNASSAFDAICGPTTQFENAIGNIFVILEMQRKCFRNKKSFYSALVYYSMRIQIREIQ